MRLQARSRDAAVQARIVSQMWSGVVCRAIFLAANIVRREHRCRKHWTQKGTAVKLLCNTPILPCIELRRREGAHNSNWGDLYKYDSIALDVALRRDFFI